MIKVNGKTCPPDDLVFVTTLFEQNTTSIPPSDFCDNFCGTDGETSNGFYRPFLLLTKYKADPKEFFAILEVDRKIGWTNPAHVESLVFHHKAIKIIQDEKVSGAIIKIEEYHYFKHVSNNIFRIGANGVNFGKLVWLNLQIRMDYKEISRALE